MSDEYEEKPSQREVTELLSRKITVGIKEGGLRTRVDKRVE